MTDTDADGPEPRSVFDEHGFDLTGTRRDARVNLFATASERDFAIS
jgi:hypothetical protein